MAFSAGTVSVRASTSSAMRLARSSAPARLDGGSREMARQVEAMRSLMRNFIASLYRRFEEEGS